MSLDAWITILVTLFIFLALLKDLAPPDILFLGAAVLLTLFGVIDPKEALAGFSNPGVITVALLFIVAAGLRETGVLEYVGQRVLSSAQSEHSALRRLAAVVIPMSAFLNNTPIVAMFMPVVLDWSRRRGVSPSKLLMPLSFLTILGGTCTLIGTSTNLVTQGLLVESQMKPMSLFELAWVGVPYAIIGTLYLMTVGSWLLPERKDLLEQMGEARREYMVEMSVPLGCRLIGQSIEAAGLRNLPGLFLVEIDRQNLIISPVGPDDVLLERDRLVFTGVVSSIVDLQNLTGLVPATDPLDDKSSQQSGRPGLCEAVISHSSPLVGKTIREADFRAVYGAAVLAVHRSGSRISGKVGDIVLRPGDTLLLQVRPHFMRSHRNDPSFYLVSDVPEWRPLRRDRAWLATLLLAILLVLMTLDIIPAVVAAAAVALLMVTMGCISHGDARQAVDWQVIVTIASSFAVGSALQNSGAAAAIAEVFVDLTKSLGPIAILAGVYLLASIVTELITNNAVVVLMFPICVEMAKQYDISPRPLLIALTLAASASFMTPIGYQTNMMVYGAGGYKFSDYLRVGAPLNIILWPVAVLLIPVFWPFR